MFSLSLFTHFLASKNTRPCLLGILITMRFFDCEILSRFSRVFVYPYFIFIVFHCTPWRDLGSFTPIHSSTTRVIFIFIDDSFISIIIRNVGFEPVLAQGWLNTGGQYRLTILFGTDVRRSKKGSCFIKKQNF